MQHHRFADMLGGVTGDTSGGVAVATAPAGFMMCPVMCLATPATLLVWQEVYRVAYERTRAALAPSRLETYFRPSVN